MANQGTFNWGGGTLAIPMTVAAAGTLNVNGAAVILAGALTNAGIIQWSGSGSSITVYNNPGASSGSVHNQAGALFDIQNDLGVYCACYGFEFFQNAGTVRKSAGAGTTSFNVAFTNAGTVDAQSGTIQFGGGGNIGGGYNTAAGATIQFTTGNYTETGTVTNTGAGLFRQYGANVTLNDRITKFILAYGNVALSPTFDGSGAIQNLQLDGAYLTGTNRVTGTLGIDGGGLALASPLTVTATGVLDFNGAAVTINSPLTNAGTVNWSGSTLVLANDASGHTGAIYNQPGGLFDLQSDQAVSSAGYNHEFFSNAGTVRKTAGLGISSFNIAFTNTGTVDAQSGTIQFGGGSIIGSTIGGTYNTASGATIQFTGGSFTETGPVTVTGSGLCRQNGATVTLTDQIANFVLAAGNVALSPTFEGSGAIQNLQLDGATLTGTNTVTGTLGMDGGGLAVASPLTVATNGVLNFNGAAVTINSPLTNAGTVNWSGSTLVLANNASGHTGAIYNQPGGLFDLQSDQAVSSAGYNHEFFSNAGTVRKTAGLGISSFNIAFTNTGTVDAQSGTIQFGGGSIIGSTIGGTYNTASGATIQFTGGSFTETGSVTVTGSGLCRQNGATVTLNDQIANFVLAAGNVALSPTFDGSGAIQNLQLDGAYSDRHEPVTGTLGMDGGSLALASPLTVTATGVLNFNGAAVTINSPLTNAGTVNWSGSTLVLANNASGHTGAIYNQPGGLFDLQSDQAVSSAGYDHEFFSNAGTVRKTAGLGISSFNIAFTNTGTVDAQSGTIQFGGGSIIGSTIGGTYNTASGATIQFTGGSFTESGPVTVTGSGLCRQNGATVTLNDRINKFILANGNVVLSPTFEGSGAIQNLQLDGAYLTGTNRVTGTLGIDGGGLALASPLTVTATGVLDFNGAAVTINSPLTNAGTVNWSGGTLVLANNAGVHTGAIYNQPGGLFILQSDQAISSAGYGSEFFINAGTVRKTAGLGISSINIAFTNTDILDAQSGTIRIAGPYAQTGGTMNFGITSLADFGQIAFSANAPLTGTLSVNFNGGYFPSAGDSFALLTYASRTGVFTSLALPPQAQWQTNYSASTFTLSVLSVTGGLSVPFTLTPVSLAAGHFTLQINGSVGSNYILQGSSDFTNWTPLSTNTPR